MWLKELLLILFCLKILGKNCLNFYVKKKRSRERMFFKNLIPFSFKFEDQCAVYKYFFIVLRKSILQKFKPGYLKIAYLTIFSHGRKCNFLSFFSIFRIRRMFILQLYEVKRIQSVCLCLGIIKRQGNLLINLNIPKIVSQR